MHDVWDFIFLYPYRGDVAGGRENCGMNLLCVTLQVNLIAALAKKRVCNCTVLHVDTVASTQLRSCQSQPAEENNRFLHKSLSANRQCRCVLVAGNPELVWANRVETAQVHRTRINA